MYKKYVLDNQLRLILAPLKATKAVTVLVLVGTGSRYESKEINGISHFLEHMFFKGTKKRPNKLLIAETLDRIGGEYNAFTGKETTGFWAKVASQHLDLALDWISDILLNSKFESQEIEKERGVILEERNMYLDTPMKYVGELWEELLYGDQPIGWPIVGTIKTISSLQRKQFLDYYKRHYLSNNTVVVIAGGFDSKIAKKLAEKNFVDLTNKDNGIKEKTIENQKKPESLIYYKKTDQTHLCLGVRAYDLFHPDKYALSLLSIILGGNMSSRLFISVRENRGLAYYIRTSVDLFTDTGYLVTQAGVDNKKVEQAIKTILKEYKQIARTVKESELQKAKDYLKGISLLEMESSDAIASFYAAQEILTNKILTLSQKFAQIDRVKLEDIQRVACDIFQPEKLNLALIGPFRDKKFFQNLLEI